MLGFGVLMGIVFLYGQIHDTLALTDEAVSRSNQEVHEVEQSANEVADLVGELHRLTDHFVLA